MVCPACSSGAHSAHTRQAGCKLHKNSGDIPDAGKFKGAAKEKRDPKIAIGSRKSKSPYINARVQLVVGRTVTDAIGILVPNSRGEQTEYQHADLLYDSSRSYLRVPGQRPNKVLSREGDSDIEDSSHGPLPTKRQRKSTERLNLGMNSIRKSSN
jgi:hypothetical protein